MTAIQAIWKQNNSLVPKDTQKNPSSPNSEDFAFRFFIPNIFLSQIATHTAIGSMAMWVTS